MPKSDERFKCPDSLLPFYRVTAIHCAIQTKWSDVIEFNARRPVIKYWHWHIQEMDDHRRRSYYDSHMPKYRRVTSIVHTKNKIAQGVLSKCDSHCHQHIQIYAAQSNCGRWCKFVVIVNHWNRSHLLAQPKLMTRNMFLYGALIQLSLNGM